MQFSDLSVGDVFAVIGRDPSPLFRKTYHGGVEEVRGGDYTGKIISHRTRVIIRPQVEVLRVDPSSITGKQRK